MYITNTDTDTTASNESQAMEGAQEQPRGTSKKWVIDPKLLHELTDKDDLPGIKQYMSALQEQSGVPVSELKKVPLVQRLAVNAASAGHRDMALYFVEEMGVRINGDPLARASAITPLTAAIVEGHEDLALQLLALLGQGEQDLNRPLARGRTILMYSAGVEQRV